MDTQRYYIATPINILVNFNDFIKKHVSLQYRTLRKTP